MKHALQGYALAEYRAGTEAEPTYLPWVDQYISHFRECIQPKYASLFLDSPAATGKDLPSSTGKDLLAILPTLSGLAILRPKGLAILSAKGLAILSAKGLAILSAKGPAILSAKGLAILTPKGLAILTPKGLAILSAKIFQTTATTHGKQQLVSDLVRRRMFQYCLGLLRH
jgi:hypothetical protein